MQFPPALRHRSYRFFFCGLMISQMGVWMQGIAMSWLVYRLTDSVFMLGIVGFASQIPVLFLAPLGGLLADRFNRHKLIMATQAVAMCQAATLATLTLLGWIQPWHLIALALLLGTIYAIDTPVRQSMTARLVEDPKNLASAITLNGLGFNLSRLVGPSVGGLVVASYGEGVCFLINVFTYAITIGFLAQLRMQSGGQIRSLAGGLSAGFRFAFGTLNMRVMLLLVGTIALCGLPYTVLLPYFAKNVYGGNADSLGVLMSALSLGGISAALYSLGRRTMPAVPGLIYKAAIMLGMMMIALPQMPGLWWAILPIATAGGCTFLIGNGTTTMMQTLVPDELRGRMMSIFSMLWFGLVPLGSLIAGTLADVIGPEHTVAFGGLITVISGAMFRPYVPRLRGLFK